MARTTGQVAAEYLMLLGMALILITPMIIFSVNTSATQRALTDGEVALARVASAAESVYAQGVGAKQTVAVYIPEASNLPASTISDNTIRLRVYVGGSLTDITHPFPFNVTGSLPLTPGYQQIPVETLANGVVQIGAPAGPVCGNNVRETGEECDGSDLGGATCLIQLPGSIGGTLSCTTACTYDTSACLLGTYTYVDAFDAHNGTVTNFANAKSAADGEAFATFSEEGYAGSQQTLTLNANEVVSSGAWTLVDQTYTSDDLKATVTSESTFQVGVQNTSASGAISSIVVRVEQNIVGVSGNDGFSVLATNGTTDGTACSLEPGTTLDAYLECNITDRRPGGGTWTFADINNTRVKVSSTRQGALPTSWNVDHVALVINYTPPTEYTMNITTNFTGVPSGVAYTLEIRYNVTGDTFTVYVWDNSSQTFINRGTLNSTTTAVFTYVLETVLANEYNGGEPVIRFVDATPRGTTQGTLRIDYERIATTLP